MQVSNTKLSYPKKFTLLARYLRHFPFLSAISILRYSSRIFDYKFYSEISKTKKNIFAGYLYFITKGVWTGNKINQHFESSIYINAFPQSTLKSSFPLLHYLAKSSGSNPVTSFDRRYLGLNPDVMAFKGPLLYHYMKFKSIEHRQLASETEMQNSRYAIKVKLPRSNTQYNLPYTNINVDIIYRKKPSISDTDSFERKTQIQVYSSLKFNSLLDNEEQHLEVKSTVHFNVIKIEIQTGRQLFFDIKWLRDLVMSYSSLEDFDISEFSSAIQFLISSVANRIPNDAELLGSVFPLSICDIWSKEENTQITFSNLNFNEDENRAIVRKKILLVSHEDSYTGAPLYLLQIARYLRAQGIEVQVLCIRAKFKNGVFSNEGFNTFYVEDLSSQDLLVRDWLLNDLGKNLITDFLKKIAPSQIWINSINASCLIELADRLDTTSCLFVHESFGFMSYEYLANEYEVLFHTALEKADLVVFGSDYSKESFSHNGIRSNGVVLSSLKVNDFETEKWSLEMRNSRRLELDIGPDTTVFLSMATFEPRKRITDILNAFENAMPDNSVLILVGHVGDDEYSDHVKKQTHGKSNILVFPVTKEPSYFYSIADVLILASESETYPLVLQEAIHWDLLRIVAKFPGYGASCDERSALMFEVGSIDNLESLIKSSSLLLESTQDIQTFAKLHFLEKQKSYHRSLRSILKNLSLVNINIEDMK